MTPTKNESLPELVARWRDESGDWLSGDVRAAYRRHASELEAALTREAPTEGVDYDEVYLLLSSARSNIGARRPDYDEDDANHWDRLSAAMESVKAASLRQHGSIRHPATPPAPQRHPDALENGSLSKSTAKRVDALRLAQGEDNNPNEFGANSEPNPKALYWQYRARVWQNRAIELGWKITENNEAAQPPHQDRGEVEKRARELLDRAAQEDRAWREHQGGFVRADAGEDARRVALRAITAAMTEAKQQGPGEAVCRDCRGVGEVEGLVPHASGNPQDDSWGVVPCATCNGTGGQANG